MDETLQVFAMVAFVTRCVFAAHKDALKRDIFCEQCHSD